jgi:transcriptional regulator with XRE-family HTH domain
MECIQENHHLLRGTRFRLKGDTPPMCSARNPVEALATKQIAVASNGGQRLRALREVLGYTMRDVEGASLQIARRLGSDEYAIPPSRLSDIETKGVVPSIFRIYSMAAVYRRNYRELLSWYGVNLSQTHLDAHCTQPPNSHLSTTSDNLAQVSIPVCFDPGFNPEKTVILGRVIEKWGVVPLSYLSIFASDKCYSYGLHRFG